jgi:hypothetical protein
MLHDFDKGGKVVTKPPFEAKLRFWLQVLAKRVHPLAIDTVKQAFRAELHDGIVTTSWVPGADWWATPYQCLYDALQDEIWAAQFFGLIACECVLERCAETGEDWGYGHYEKDGVPIKGRTYFRLGTVNGTLPKAA